MKKLICFIFILLLIPSVCFSASSRVLPTSYNEKTYGSNAGKSAEDDDYRDYTSLATWEADTDTNLVTATSGEVLTCYADSSTYDDVVYISEATTNASYFRVLRATSGARGTPTSGVRFESVNLGYTIRGKESYLGLYDIAAKSVSTTHAAGIAMFGSHYGRIVGVTAYNCTGSTFGCGILVQNNTDVVIANCFVTGCTSTKSLSGGIVLSTSARVSNYYVYNNTVTSGCYGIRVYNSASLSLTVTSKNNISQDNTSNISEYGTVTHTQTTNVTSGVTFAADDYHLASTDTGAIDEGTDLSSDGTFAFDDDIDGDTRSDWDVGCDEYITAAPATGHGMGMFFSY